VSTADPTFFGTFPIQTYPNAFRLRFKICDKAVQANEEQLNEIYQPLGGAGIAKLLGGNINRPFHEENVETLLNAYKRLV
jgi:hypothetical protein